MIRDALLALWFAVVATAFFAPYLGLGDFSNVARALYALVLIGAIASAALRLVGRRP